MTTEERRELVRYRFNRATETFSEIDLLLQNKYLNNAVNRMYYACFYALNALFLDKNIKAKSHAGVKQMFGLHFVKTGMVSKEAGDFYTFIFDMRHTGDYDDYIVFDQKEIASLLEPAANFIAQIEQILSIH